MKKNKLTYKEAGVDIDAGNNLIQNIKPFIKETLRPEVLSDIGGFGAIVEVSKKYRNPVLVSGTDGVGTKLKLAIEWNMHKTIGFDLVAMSVNDILVQGAEPLFFLDYFACGKLDINLATEVIKGIALACKESNCSLIGGETAEMPGMYPIGDYDLAGFAVGIAEKDKIITGKNIKENDIIIGITSNGAHSNGYSLIRKIIEIEKPDLNQIFDNNKTFKEVILAPTKLYVKTILNLLRNIEIKGIAHITGGGITENIPRVIPKSLQAVIDTSSWTFPKLFKWLQDKGCLSKEECLRTFNCGIGMVVIVDENDKNKVLDALKKENEIGYTIGHITSKNDNPNIINII